MIFSEKWYTPNQKKCYQPKILFFHLRISLSFFECVEILYRWKANILNFFMIQKFFCILKIFWVINFWVINFWIKIVSFFTISINIIFSFRFKKIFFLWKVLVALIILEKSFWKNLSPLIRFLHCELYPHFETMKIVYFLFNFLMQS